MQVSEIAALLQVSNGTVRNWTREYRKHLSEGAAPPTGQTREYTENDLQVLSAVRFWKDQGATPQEITERLQSGDHEREAIPLPERKEKEPPQEQRALATLDLIQRYEDQIQALYQELDRRGQEIGYLKGRLETLEERLTRKTWLDRLLRR